MLPEAQEAGQILDEEQLAFLVDPGIPAGQAQTIIPDNAAFQTEYLDTYNSDYFEINDLKARLQDKDMTICKLKDTIKSLRKNTKEENMNHDKCELEPINEELENSVAKILSENERLCNEINQGKKLVENAVHIPSATTISPDMFKLDLVPLPPSRKQAKAKKPLDGGLKLACRMPQEFRVLVSVFQDTSGSVSPVIADKEPPEQ
ncbi:hypothetical protein Tco_0858923 [Tanacetum coccineum]|uniref:Uncharacterized protein n=1 Tax=Tanacetum coccineum TaxID=301880 RepID=A0ABQ5BE99_9ASTR